MNTSEPTDSSAVLLARIEVKLDNALSEQARHTTIIDRHDVRITKVENRLTAVETARATDDSHGAQRLTSKQIFWGALGVLAVVLSPIITTLLTHRG